MYYLFVMEINIHLPTYLPTYLPISVSHWQRHQEQQCPSQGKNLECLLLTKITSLLMNCTTYHNPLFSQLNQGHSKKFFNNSLYSFVPLTFFPVSLFSYILATPSKPTVHFSSRVSKLSIKLFLILVKRFNSPALTPNHWKFSSNQGPQKCIRCSWGRKQLFN